MAVSVRFDELTGLGAAERAQMFELLQRHFHGVDPQVFAADLREKSHVLRLFSAGGDLSGFSTLDYRMTEVAGAPAALLYSGDTIVDPAAWAQTSLGPAWVAAVFDLHASVSPGMPLWWLLLSSGVRTYRYLTVCLRSYAPADAERFDPVAAALLPGLACDRFGAAFDRTAGVVRFVRPQRLRAHLCEIPAHVANDAAVRVFLQRNPGHVDGDELVSLCRLCPENLTGAGRLALRRGRAALAVSS
ncbi:MAG: hypothetical protein H0V44_09670 [Planctomycetes bacterium]|nr:hypothetical protein [Planctomycetota bacterium]